MEEIRVKYLCDRKVEGCERATCYKRNGILRRLRGTGCRHTSDVRHAKNFGRTYRKGAYRERTPAFAPVSMVAMTIRLVENFLRHHRRIVERFREKRGDPKRSPEEQEEIDDEVFNEWLHLFGKHMKESSPTQYDTHEES